MTTAQNPPVGHPTPGQPPAATPRTPDPWPYRAGDWAVRLLALTAGLCPTLSALGAVVAAVLLALAVRGTREQGAAGRGRRTGSATPRAASSARRRG